MGVFLVTPLDAAVGGLEGELITTDPAKVGRAGGTCSHSSPRTTWSSGAQGPARLPVTDERWPCGKLQG